MAESKLEMLFGKIAVACGFVTDDALEQALDSQELKSDTHRHLGRILVEQEAMTEDELMTVLAIQRENRLRAELSPAVRRLGVTLGSLAVEREYCKLEDVHECIREQARLERLNLFFRLGEVMCSKGVLSIEQVHELLASQNITILGCPGCFSKYNVLNYREGAKLECPKCSTGLELPGIVSSIKVDANIDGEG